MLALRRMTISCSAVAMAAAVVSHANDSDVIVGIMTSYIVVVLLLLKLSLRG